jgi:hypothetical protein
MQEIGEECHLSYMRAIVGATELLKEKSRRSLRVISWPRLAVRGRELGLLRHAVKDCDLSGKRLSM